MQMLAESAQVRQGLFASACCDEYCYVLYVTWSICVVLCACATLWLHRAGRLPVPICRLLTSLQLPNNTSSVAHSRVETWPAQWQIPSPADVLRCPVLFTYVPPAASAPSAITVGAVDNNDITASFSNWGSCVDILPQASISTVLPSPAHTQGGPAPLWLLPTLLVLLRACGVLAFAAVRRSVLIL